MASIWERAPSGGRLNGYQPHLLHPSWDLSIVLEGHQFESLESVSHKLLGLLVALSSLKWIGDLQALFVGPSFMDFASGLVKFLLQPWLEYVPKVASTPFRTQQVIFEAFPLLAQSLSDVQPHGLCPVRALKTYVDHKDQWRKSDQLFAVTKQKMSHWITDAMLQPIRCAAWLRLLVYVLILLEEWFQDNCVGAGWSSPHTFIRIYGLKVGRAPGSLSSVFYINPQM